MIVTKYNYKIYRFYESICSFYMKLIIMVSNRGLMTIYFMSFGIMHGKTWVRKLASNKQNRQFRVFFFMIVTRYITRYNVLLINLFPSTVIHHIGITQRPHDHLFQKWGIWVQLGCINNCKQAKTNTILVTHIGLMTIYFKSGASGCNLGAETVCKQAKINKFESFSFLL